MAQRHEVSNGNGNAGTGSWASSEFLVQMPGRWIDPSVVKSLLPPYYAGIVDRYQDWMGKPHRSLGELPWGEEIFQLYTPRSPSAKENDGEAPSTYLFYEALYLFAAGIITGKIPPVEGLERERADYLKRKITVNTLELMSAVAGLGRGDISFDAEHSRENKTSRLITPRLVDNQGNRSKIRTFTSRGSSQLQIDFKPKIGRFNIDYKELDTFHFTPPRTEGLNTSIVAQLALDRGRSGLSRRKLQMKLSVAEVVWGNHDDGKFLPMRSEWRDLLGEYLGTNIHHVDLALTESDRLGRSMIDRVIFEAMRELGLSPLLELPSEPSGTKAES